jgi:hypothetical protein
MSSIAILREVKQLYNVSDRLDSLAEQHPVVSEALITISGKRLICSSFSRGLRPWTLRDD